jgi:ABC-type transport system involved in multi-copper enzyme maturation permease subunit
MRGPKIDAGKIIGIIFFAVVILYLFTTLFVKEAGSYMFQDPGTAGIESMVLWVLKAGIIAMAVWLGSWVMKKVTGSSISRRDIIAFVVVGVAVYFIWEYALVHIVNAQTLNDITSNLGQKLGLLP